MNKSMCLKQAMVKNNIKVYIVIYINIKTYLAICQFIIY